MNDVLTFIIVALLIFIVGYLFFAIMFIIWPFCVIALAIAYIYFYINRNKDK